MKKAFVIGGVVLVGLLAIAGSIIGYWAYCGTALDRSSRAFVDEAIPAIATGWSPHELVKRESPSFFKATSDDQLVKLFVAFRKLGALKTYRGSKGEETINVTADSGKVVTATYVGLALVLSLMAWVMYMDISGLIG